MTEKPGTESDNFAREYKSLQRVMGKPSLDLQRVVGWRRPAVDLMIGRRGAGAFFNHLRKDSPAPINIINMIGAQLALTGVAKNLKYVYYDGHIFIDCFAPKWPGKVFGNLAEKMVSNLGYDQPSFLPFIPSLVFSITKKCVYRCEHCYAINTLGESDRFDLQKMISVARDFQKIGVGVIAWEGGEPLLRFEELLELIRRTSDQSESLIATTGYGLTPDKARQLKEAGLISAIISLDHYDPDKHNLFRRNKKAFDMAVNGVRIFRENGILPSIAICATSELMAEDGLYQYIELAREIGAAFVQVLDATPAGNYLGQDVALSVSDLEKIKKFHIEINNSPAYRDYPAVQARALLEDDSLHGCCAANALVYIDSSGNVQPCDLLQISFGNVFEEETEVIYRRLKEVFAYPLKGRCPAQSLHRDIAACYEKSGETPIPLDECAPVIDRLKQRGQTELVGGIKARRARRSLLDLFRKPPPALPPPDKK